MDIGVCIFATDYAIPIDELARETEARGFESLWVPEHTHIPSSRRSPWAGGAELPKEYWHTYDPFVSLMYAAAVTKTLKLGTGICLIIERDTITRMLDHFKNILQQVVEEPDIWVMEISLLSPEESPAFATPTHLLQTYKSEQFDFQ